MDEPWPNIYFAPDASQIYTSAEKPKTTDIDSFFTQHDACMHVHGGYATLNNRDSTTWCRTIMEKMFVPRIDSAVKPTFDRSFVVERQADKLAYHPKTKTFEVE